MGLLMLSGNKGHQCGIYLQEVSNAIPHNVVEVNFSLASSWVSKALLISAVQKIQDIKNTMKSICNMLKYPNFIP